LCFQVRVKKWKKPVAFREVRKAAPVDFLLDERAQASGVLGAESRARAAEQQFVLRALDCGGSRVGSQSVLVLPGRH
jgi:hypothetical protein